MPFDAHNIESIEAYLKNDLAIAERQLFDKQLETDKTLQQEVEKYRTIFQGLRMKRLEAVKAKVNRLENSLPSIEPKHKKEDNLIVPTTDSPPKTAKRQRLWWSMVAAASLLFLLWIYTSSDTQDYRTIAGTYYTLPDLGTRSTTPTEFEKGIAAFNTKEYTQAKILFSNIPRNSPEYYSAQYCLAHIYYQEQNYKKAKTDFLLAMEHKDNLTTDILLEDLEWYYLLSCLADNDWNAKAKAVLATILQNPDHYHYQKAMGLKKALE